MDLLPPQQKGRLMIKRILVADDSEAIQKAIRIAFAPFDVKVFEASSYVETLNQCKECRPELLIIDASLTGTEGSQYFLNLQKECAGAPLLLLEGSYEPIDHASFQGLGSHCFLKKPFDSQELLLEVTQNLGLDIAKKPVSIPPPPPPPSDPFANIADSELNLSLDEPGKGFVPPPPPVHKSRVSENKQLGLSPEELRALIAPLVQEELAQQVKKAVEAYCREHFPPLAREVITQELRRLADDKARHLVDN